MKHKTIILLIVILGFSSHLFGQVDRKNAKSMDTCAVSVISSEIIKTQAPTDSLNRFEVTCNCQLPKYRLSVFDRWGKVALSSYNINDSLIFTDLKSGAYVWVVEVKYPNGKKDSKKGVLNIE